MLKNSDYLKLMLLVVPKCINLDTLGSVALILSDLDQHLKPDFLVQKINNNLPQFCTNS